MKVRKTHVAASLSAGSILLLTTLTTQAQSPRVSGAQGAESRLEEITVTARRREESLQAVPVSISAVTGADLEQAGVHSVQDLGRIAPSLTVTTSPRGANTPSFVIRGQRLIDFSPTLDPVVVMYFNEVPFMRPNGLNAAMFDISSVQVLRGPQGTLFGRNSTGGAVLVNTATPADEFDARASVELGNYSLRTFEGMLNVPLGERAAIRFAAVDSDRDGYMRDRVTGRRANDVNYDAQRITLLWEPIDGLKTVTYGNRFYARDQGSASQIYAYDPARIAGFLGLNPALSPQAIQDIVAGIGENVASNERREFTFAHNLAGREYSKTWDVSNVTTYELNDAITLKNVAGYRDIEAISRYDLDASRAQIQDQLAGASEGHQFSEEFQVLGAAGDFDWIVGAFYFREKGTDIGTSVLGNTPNTIRLSGGHYLNKSYSAFATGTYRFGTSGWSLSAGARYTKDERRYDGLQQVGNACGFSLSPGVFIQPPCLYRQEKSFKEPSWSVSLSYEVNPDLTVYLAHRHGYRSGGVQQRATSVAAAVPFDPETVNDIELGSKWQFAAGDLEGRVNASVFYARYQDIQRQLSFISPVNNTLVSGILNAAKSEVPGAELEIVLLPIAALELSASAGYVDPKYKKFVSNGVDVSDTPFGFVPKWTVNAQAAYTLPTPANVGEITLATSYRYQSKIYNADLPDRFGWLPSFGIYNARVTWAEAMGTRLGVSAYVNNITDKEYYPFGTNLYSQLGFAIRAVAPPRLYGVQLTYDF